MAELEVSPLARVKRSRIAFALSVTLAAVPVLVLDNMSATAETSEARVEVSSDAEELPRSAPSTTVTTEASTTTTVAPTTTAPPAPTTEAPPTTEAVVLQAFRASAPVAPAPTAPPTTAAPPPPAPGPYGDPSDPATWDRLAQCESGGNWAMNNGNGYYGGLQFSLATWQNVGGSGYPHQASRAEQIKRGQILQSRAGWGQWPHCTRQLGY